MNHSNHDIGYAILNISFWGYKPEDQLSFIKYRLRELGYTDISDEYLKEFLGDFYIGDNTSEDF